MSTAHVYVASTGAGVVIGSGAIELSAVLRNSSVASTVIIKDSAATVITLSAEPAVTFTVPVALSGPVTMTSSGGSGGTIVYRSV